MRSSAGRSKAGNRTRKERPPAYAGRSRGVLDALEPILRGEFPATLFLEGPSEALKAAWLGEVRNAWRTHCPESPTARVFTARESGVEEILAAYQSASLFSPRDLVLVLEIEDLGRSEKRVAALARGLATPAGGSSLVLVESAAEQVRKSLDPLRAACRLRVDAQPPGRTELLRWATLRLEREGIEAEEGLVETITDACEGDALAFFGELDKLCSWAAPTKRLVREDLARLLRPAVGADLPEYLAAVSLGDPALATQRLGRLLATGVGEGTVLFSLANLVGGALGGWARHRELSATLRHRLSPRALAGALDAVYRAESAWKGGRADPVAVLEQATRAVATG